MDKYERNFPLLRKLCIKFLLLCCFAGAYAQGQQNSRTISGIIKEASGLPVIGANIAVKGTNLGVISGLDGDFKLEVPEGAVIVVSYIGFLKQEITVKDQTSFNITLKEDAKKLEEVVVIGYGKMKKGDLSAAVSNVSNVDKLLDRPVTNAEEMLQGQIPGVTITANGGQPNSAPSIQIRGMGSRNGEAPLYVVDGVPGASFSMSDVVSMTVLKDAASAAIYGAYAGSAGVILVTTRQAAEGRTSVEYNGMYGLSTAMNLPQSLTIDEERQVRAMALGGEQFLPDGWDAAKNPYIGQTRTDWIDEIFRTAPVQRHSVSVSGGTKEFSNRASFEYSDRQGTLLNTYAKNISARLNSMWKINQYVRVREDLSWRNNKTRGADTSSSQTGVLLSAMSMPRNAEAYNADGSYGGTAPSDQAYIDQYGSNYADIHGDVINPVRQLKAAYDQNNNSTFMTSTFLDITEPIKGLNFTSRFTYKQENYFQRYFSPRRLEPGKPQDQNDLAYTSSRLPQWDFENTLNYDRVFQKHNVGAMFSTTTNESTYRWFQSYAHDFKSEDEAVMYYYQAGNIERPSDLYWKDRNVSFVGRLSYSYADRYFITGSWRRDYAGRLPKGEKYGDFPSATGAWKVTSEPFFPKNDILNLLKIRASWGRIGNLGSIARGYGYPVMEKHSLGNDVGGQIGATPRIEVGMFNKTGYNPDLTWETSEQLDLGMDAALFKNRMNITFDYFKKKTMDLIKAQDAGWTNSIGILPMLVNEGEVHNSGFELAVNWADKAGKVNYWLSGNMATLKNRLYNIGEAGPNGEKPVWTDGGTYRELAPYRSAEGQPLYSFYLIKTDGVFKTQQEIDSHTGPAGQKIQPNAQVGDLKFIDENKDGKIDGSDRVYMGNAMPKYTYSFSGGLDWNNFTFSFMLQGVAKAQIFNAFKNTVLNESNSSYNRSRDILKALGGPNDDVPRITASDPNGNFSTTSDYYLEDGSFLRIKNLSLGYSFTKLMNKVGYLKDRNSSLDVTFSVDNLATFTKYTGTDPEVGGDIGLPSQGASAGAKSTTATTYIYGLDYGQYPVARTFSVAVKLKF